MQLFHKQTSIHISKIDMFNFHYWIGKYKKSDEIFVFHNAPTQFS